MIAGTVFFLRMCDEECQAVYLTFLNSFVNFGYYFAEALNLYLLDIVGLKVLTMFGFIYNILYFIIWRKKLLHFENGRIEDWALNCGVEKKE